MNSRADAGLLRQAQGVWRDERLDEARRVVERLLELSPHHVEALTQEYCAADKRCVGNAAQVSFCDGSSTERVQVDFPIRQRRRRAAGMPVLVKKFESAVDAQSSPKQAAAIHELMAAMATNGPPASPAPA